MALQPPLRVAASQISQVAELDPAGLDPGVVKLTRYTYVAVLTKMTKEFGPTRIPQGQVYATTAEVMTKIMRQTFDADDVRRHLV